MKTEIYAAPSVKGLTEGVQITHTDIRCFKTRWYALLESASIQSELTPRGRVWENVRLCQDRCKLPPAEAAESQVGPYEWLQTSPPIISAQELQFFSQIMKKW